MTVEDNEIIEVKNLANHTVGFVDEDSRRRVVFAGGEVKKLPASILRSLNFTHGGHILLTQNLSVKNTELAREFGVSEETVEYNWDMKDVDRVLIQGSLDELMDALEFGPTAIKELIIDRAVAMKLKDMDKRKAIFDITGHDITQKIALMEAYNQATGENDNEAPASTGRRVNKKEGTSGRRVSHTEQTEIVEETTE